MSEKPEKTEAHYNRIRETVKAENENKRKSIQTLAEEFNRPDKNNKLNKFIRSENEKTN